MDLKIMTQINHSGSIHLPFSEMFTESIESNM